MKTKTNITELDIELDLFDINDWDFNKSYDNYTEYKSWIDDENLFDVGVETFVYKLPMLMYGIVFAALLAIITVVAVYLARPSKDYLEVLTIDNQLKKDDTVEYIEGTVATDDEVIEASKVCTVYFQILNSKKGYSLLDSLCLDSSSFYREYSKNVDKIRYSYDMYDCYVRLLGYYGSYCVLNKIDKLVEKNGVYYCYLDITAPSKEDISGYVKLYSYNFTKHFTVTDFNEANMVRYMYSMEGVSKIPCSRQTICLTMKKNASGDLFILEDDVITGICIDAYKETLTDISNLMGVRIGK